MEPCDLAAPVSEPYSQNPPCGLYQRMDSTPRIQLRHHRAVDLQLHSSLSMGASPINLGRRMRGADDKDASVNPDTSRMTAELRDRRGREDLCDEIAAPKSPRFTRLQCQ